MVTEVFTVRYRQVGSNVVIRSLDRIGGAANTATRGLFLLQRALFVVGGAGLATALAQQVDALTQYENRIRLTAQSSAEVEKVQDALFAAANRSRTAFGSLAEIYTRVALSVKDLGISSAETVRFTESLAKATIISGASAREANAALIQLGQGLASNRLSGDELRSVLEQLPFVAQVIADELGVTRGALRQLGREGRLTADTILEAFRNAEDTIDQLFENTTPTISQAFQVLSNEALDLVDRLDDATGGSAALASSIIGLSKALDAIASGLVVAAFAGIGAGLQLIANRATGAIRKAREFNQAIRSGNAVLLTSVQVENAKAQSSLQTARAAQNASTAALGRTAASLESTRALQAAAAAEVSATRFTNLGNQARNVATGQYANLTSATAAYEAALTRQNVLSNIAASQEARLARQKALGVVATNNLAEAQGRATLASIAASTAWQRLQVAYAAATVAALRLGAALRGLLALIAANPITAALTAISLFISAQLLLADTTDQLNDSMNETDDIARRVADAYKKVAKEGGAVKDIIEDFVKLEDAQVALKNATAANAVALQQLFASVDQKGLDGLANNLKAIGKFELFGEGNLGPFLNQLFDLGELAKSGAISIEKFKTEVQKLTAAEEASEAVRLLGNRVIEYADAAIATGADTEYLAAVIAEMTGTASSAQLQLIALRNAANGLGTTALTVAGAIRELSLGIPDLADQIKQQDELSEATRLYNEGLKAARNEANESADAAARLAGTEALLLERFKQRVGIIDGTTEATNEAREALDKFTEAGRINNLTGQDRQIERVNVAYEKLQEQLKGSIKDQDELTNALNQAAIARDKQIEGIKAQAAARASSDPLFKEEVRNLEREVELLELSVAKREELTNILAIEDALKRSLTATEKAYVQELTEEIRLLQVRNELIGPLESAQQKLADTQRVLNELLMEGKFSADQYAEALRNVQSAADKVSGTFTGGFRSAISDAIMSAGEFGEAIGQKIVGFANSAADAIVDFARTGKINLRELFAQLFADLARLAAQQLLLMFLGNILGIPVAGLGGIGARADGGPVTAGGTYLVGERGPELFTPSTSGRVISNEQMRAQQTQQSVAMENIIKLQIVNVGAGGSESDVPTQSDSRRVVNAIRDNAETVNKILRG